MDFVKITKELCEAVKGAARPAAEAVVCRKLSEVFNEGYTAGRGTQEYWDVREFAKAALPGVIFGRMELSRDNLDGDDYRFMAERALKIGQAMQAAMSEEFRPKHPEEPKT